MNGKTVKELEGLILAYRDETSSYLSQIKEALSTSLQVVSYFTYSSNIFHDVISENIVIGSYHISNLGNVPLRNPRICIKLSSQSPFKLSGKIIVNKSKMGAGLPGAWERVNDPKDKEVYWLKPLETDVLAPGEVLSFSHFQLKWKPEQSYSAGVQGFFYSDEIKEGIPSLNQIHIYGTVQHVE